MAEPHWLVVAFISAFLGLALPKIWLYSSFLVKQRTQHPLEGEWYGYYLIFRGGQSDLGCEKLVISRGIHLSKIKLVLHGNSLDNPAQAYCGEAWEEAGWLVIRMNPEGHDETIFVRFKNPNQVADPIKHGLWSALDHDTKPAVGPMILSRTPLQDPRKEIEKRLNYYTMDTKSKILQVQ